MMYGYGPGMGWMILMSIIWIVVIGAVVWAAVRIAQTTSGANRGRESRETRETPEEILARRFASGEIDAAAYDAARDRLGAGRPR
jgi:putative membrane protein